MRFLPLLLLAGCVSLADASEPQSADSSAVTPSSETVMAMHRRLALANAMRSSVIAADLDDAVKWSRLLATLPPIREAPERWGTWLSRIRRTATGVEESPSLEKAAQAVARVGRACGGCHGDQEHAPRFPGDGTPPPAAPGTTGHMQHHNAAVDGMWQGLVMNDVLHFGRAAKALGEAPSLDTDTAVAPQDARLHALSEKAVLAKTPAHRAEIFGSVLTTCAGCHASRTADPPTP